MQVGRGAGELADAADHVAGDPELCGLLCAGETPGDFLMGLVATVDQPDPEARGGAMHAVVINLTINEPEADLRALRDDVVPLASQAPGFVAGYWTRRSNAGLSMIVFDSEDAATAAAEQLRSTLSDPVATLENMDIREVVAHA